ncbi:molybdopterin cofactor-binding domain-containing protein [Streptomyces sp. NPDC053560]|uniref:molybdopterin cofactor-binding domain-containing protein n=1 Tax=Streptomyces sp. NPDC053560 TaxID=3365711 RepID=UPI0037CDEFE1
MGPLPGDLLGSGTMDGNAWTVRRGTDVPVPLADLVAREFGPTGYEFTGEGSFKAPVSHEAPLEAPLEAPCLFWEIGWAGTEAEVGPDTGRVTLLRLVASGDVGRAVDPLLCRGQGEAPP